MLKGEFIKMKKVLLCLFVSLVCLVGSVGATDAMPISNLYGTWYNEKTGEEFNVTSNYMEGLPYKVIEVVKNGNVMIIKTALIGGGWEKAFKFELRDNNRMSCFTFKNKEVIHYSREDITKNITIKNLIGTWDNMTRANHELYITESKINDATYKIRYEKHFGDTTSIRIEIIDGKFDVLVDKDYLFVFYRDNPNDLYLHNDKRHTTTHYHRIK